MEGGLEGKQIVVQGLGNVGFHAAKFLSEEDGALITAIIERDGAIINDAGLNIEEVHAYRMENSGVKGFPGSEYVEDGPSVLEKECDILLPAALESQIHQGNADRINTKLIAEAANGPVTFGADEILRNKGVVIIPDAYLNAGGVTVSYFEWIKNLSHIRFGRMQRRYEEAQSRGLVSAIEEATGKPVSDTTKKMLISGPDELDLVRSGLDDTMREAYNNIRDIFNARESVVDLRTASFVLAIERIADSYSSMEL
jgi:glutamate dehydrogenase (NAD(P)+)